MTRHLTVWPDGLWLVVDELGSVVSKGTWTQHATTGAITASADARDRSVVSSLAERSHIAEGRAADEVFRRAVIAIAEATRGTNAAAERKAVRR